MYLADVPPFLHIEVINTGRIQVRCQIRTVYSAPWMNKRKISIYQHNQQRTPLFSSLLTRVSYYIVNAKILSEGGGGALATQLEPIEIVSIIH